MQNATLVSGQPVRHPYITKTLKVMQLTGILIFALSLHVAAKVKSQTVDLSGKDVPLETIFSEVKKQTGFFFFYNPRELASGHPVTAEAHNVPLNDFLTLIFKDQPLKYRIDKRGIIVSIKTPGADLNYTPNLPPPPITIRGRIVNEKGEPVIASIVIKGTKRGTTSNISGDFLLENVDEHAMLLISAANIKTREIALGVNGTMPGADNITTLTISVETFALALDEVVVSKGYYSTTARMNTGSVSSVASTEIAKQPVTNVLSSVAGRMPGVFVQTTNGLPGGNINIQIRGKGSIQAGTNPLYIIDGVPYEGNAPNSVSNPLNRDNIAGTISPLNNINPADIESITVLKDADATSIYGSRGSNGVVLIATKKASSGATKISINLQKGISKIASKPKLLQLNDYLEMRKEAFANDGLTPSSDPASAAYAPDLTLWSQTQGTDWADYIFGNTAASTDIQAKISGGKGGTTFSVSGNYRYENTVLIGSNHYKRGGLYSQIHHRSDNGKLTIAVSNQISIQNADFVNPVQNIASIILIAPNYPLYLQDGMPNWYSGTNIDAELHARSKSNISHSITNLMATYTILPDLTLKVNAGYTKTTYDQTQIFPKRAISPYLINYSNFGKNSSQSYILEPLVDYTVNIRKSSLLFLAGGTFQHRTTQSQYIQGSNFSLESLMEDLGSAATINSRSNSSLYYKYASLFGRFSYDLMNTYIFNATIRRDGSSKFGPGNRFGNFGSVGAAWVFSNYRIIQEKLPFLSLAKLRGSYGTTGNDQIADYGYLSTYNSSGFTYQNATTLKPSRITNANYHWETTKKLDIGLELGLFQDKLLVNADYYVNRSDDQLVDYTLPLITGFSSYQANLPAVVENKGWEFDAHATIIKRPGFSWSASFNFTLPKNRLVSFDNFASSSYSKQYEIGYDLTRLYGYSYGSIDPVTGLPQYLGEQGEPSMNPYFFNRLGKLTPDYYGGLGNDFTCKGFQLSIFAQFVKQQSRGELQYNPGIFVYNHYDFLSSRWSLSNPNSNNPRSTANGFDPYYASSSLNIFNSSYLRIKNVSLFYTIPASIVKRLKLETFRVYAEGQNVLTFKSTNAALFDPESGALSTNIGSRNVPPVRTFVMGLQLTF